MNVPTSAITQAWTHIRKSIWIQWYCRYMNCSKNKLRLLFSCAKWFLHILFELPTTTLFGYGRTIEMEKNNSKSLMKHEKRTGWTWPDLYFKRIFRPLLRYKYIKDPFCRPLVFTQKYLKSSFASQRSQYCHLLEVVFYNKKYIHFNSLQCFLWHHL